MAIDKDNYFKDVRILNYSKVDDYANEVFDSCFHCIDLTDYHDVIEIDDFYYLEDRVLEWLEKNTNHRVYYSGELFFSFEDETDLVAFKLRWV